MFSSLICVCLRLCINISTHFFANFCEKKIMKTKFLVLLMVVEIFLVSESFIVNIHIVFVGGKA